jgi:serine/threonine-protein kinase
VWLARDAELDTLVAIKVFKADLTETQRERLRREVLLGRTLQHPGLVRVFELVDGGERLAVAMEWIPEGSLAQRLEAGPLPVDEVVRVAEQVLEVLAYLHEHGVVHRDVKPSNLLVDSDGRVRLADLGLARPLDDDRGLTKTLAAVGTPAYMSPEQIRGAPPTPAADLYGLGVTLYQLVTGALPFSGTSEYDVANKHLTEAAGDPRKAQPRCPAWLAGFILRLLEKTPRDRFRSATGAADALARRRARVSPRTMRRVAVLACAVVPVAAAAVAAYRYSERDRLASVTVTDHTLAGRDARGRTLWERSFAELRPVALMGDFIGDSAPEVAVGLTAPDGQPTSTTDLVLLDSLGRQQASYASGSGVLTPPNDVFADRILGAKPLALDLDGDRCPELGWVTSHQYWYPTVVGVWNPRAGINPSNLLLNSGHLHTVRTTDLDGDGANEMVVVGQNNPLGWQVAVAILRPSRGQSAGEGYVGGTSPDLLASWSQAIFSGVRTVASYTLLGPRGGGDELLGAGADGIVLRLGTIRRRLDRDGNPEGAPSFGMGAGARRRFWDDLSVLCREIEAGRSSGVIAALRSGHADVLAEPPMRLAADLLLARSLATAGEHREAIALLREGLDLLPEDRDRQLRLGEQLAIAGERRAALAELARATRVQTAGRSPYDAELAWAAVASLEGDAAELAKVLAFLQAADQATSHEVRRSECFAALWAFMRGDWDDNVLRHAEGFPTEAYLPVLAAWAELERGGSAEAVAAKADGLAAHAERRELAQLLRAAALVRVGRGAEGQALASRALEAVERRGRTDVLALAWAALAHRVNGEIDAALGDRRAAADHFRAAARIAPRCWFGRR